MKLDLITLAQKFREAHTHGTSIKMPLLTMNQWNQLSNLLG